MPATYYGQTRDLVVYDEQWVATRTDGHGRKDLPFDTENLRCSVCGRPRSENSWINLETRKARCARCFTPDTRLVELFRYRCDDGTLVSRHEMRFK